MGHLYIKRPAFFSSSEALDTGEEVLFLLHRDKDIHTVKQLKIYYDLRKILSEGRWCGRCCESCPYPLYETICGVMRKNLEEAPWSVTDPVEIYGRTTSSKVSISFEAIIHLKKVADKPTDALRLIMARYRYSCLEIKPAKPYYQKQPTYFALYTSEWDELKRLKGTMTLPCIIDAIILADARGEFV